MGSFPPSANGGLATECGLISEHEAPWIPDSQDKNKEQESAEEEEVWTSEESQSLGLFARRKLAKKLRLRTTCDESEGVQAEYAKKIEVRKVEFNQLPPLLNNRRSVVFMPDSGKAVPTAAEAQPPEGAGKDEECVLPPSYPAHRCRRMSDPGLPEVGLPGFPVMTPRCHPRRMTEPGSFGFLELKIKAVKTVKLEDLRYELPASPKRSRRSDAKVVDAKQFATC